MCSVLYMKDLTRAEVQQEHLEQIAEEARKRADLMRELETVTDFLREDVRAAIRGGFLSEQGASKLTGVSRMSIRAWMGKT